MAFPWYSLTRSSILDLFSIMVVKAMCVCSVMSNSAIPWNVAHQAPLSMRFYRQEYWCEVPFPSPGDLPDPGIELGPPALAGGFFTAEPSGKPTHVTYIGQNPQKLQCRLHQK